MPLRFYLPNRQKGEKIILLLRRHYFIILVKIIFWTIVAVLPLIFYLIFGDILASLFTDELFYPLVILFTSVFYLYIWLFVFFSFVDYYLDAWIVTNKRIVNIEQRGLFARVISEQRLYRVQDITSELKGLFPTFLNFGNVYIQTAGEEGRFVFKQIPNPYQVVKKITLLVEENKKFQRLMMEPKDKITT